MRQGGRHCTAVGQAHRETGSEIRRSSAQHSHVLFAGQNASSDQETAHIGLRGVSDVTGVVGSTRRARGPRHPLARKIDNTGCSAQYSQKIERERLLPAMKIQRDDWRRLLELLDTALDLQGAEREAWINGLDEPSELKEQLRALLTHRSKTSGPPFFSPPSPGTVSGPSEPDDQTVIRRVDPATPNSAVPAQLPGAQAGAALSASTDARLEDPHSWTGVYGEPVGIGTVLNERYVIERQLGEGGMGTVYLVRDTIEREFFAIKVLKDDFRAHPDALETLREEVRKSRALAGPHIIGMYDLNRHRHHLYVKMEYLQGKSLDALLAEDFAQGMPVGQAWPIIRGACAGLAYAHERGVIHSDVKPSNIFITTGGRTKVVDFGIARAVRGPRGHFDPGELGALTPTYASCEMLERDPPDVRDDVYSLACVIYELLTGKHPFRGRPATKARDERARVEPIEGLSRGQNAALARALAFSREKRTGSVEALLKGLEDLQRRRRQNIRRVAAVAVSIIGLVVGGWFARPTLQQRAADEAFVESLLKPNAGKATDYDRQTVSDLLDQGDDYLKQGTDRFDPAVLSEGVSTAYGAYSAALRLDGANRRAAEGMLKILHLYQAEAKKLIDERQYPRALELVAIGLKIDPANQQMKDMRDDLAARTMARTP
jgi:serine/threonine protein kinase